MTHGRRASRCAASRNKRNRTNPFRAGEDHESSPASLSVSERDSSVCDSEGNSLSLPIRARLSADYSYQDKIAIQRHHRPKADHRAACPGRRHRTDQPRAALFRAGRIRTAAAGDRLRSVHTLHEPSGRRLVRRVPVVPADRATGASRPALRFSGQHAQGTLGRKAAERPFPAAMEENRDRYGRPSRSTTSRAISVRRKPTRSSANCRSNRSSRNTRSSSSGWPSE